MRKTAVNRCRRLRPRRVSIHTVTTTYFFFLEHAVHHGGWGGGSFLTLTDTRIYRSLCRCVCLWDLPFCVSSRSQCSCTFVFFAVAHTTRRRKADCVCVLVQVKWSEATACSPTAAATRMKNSAPRQTDTADNRNVNNM